jgi:hypothetical protein
MRDIATLKSEQDLTWLLHTTFKTEAATDSFKIVGDNAVLDVQFINDCKQDLLSIDKVEGFGEVDPAEFADLEVHRHVEAKFKAKKEHNILTLLVPSKANGPKTEVSHKLVGNTLELTIDGEVVTIEL